MKKIQRFIGSLFGILFFLAILYFLVLLAYYMFINRNLLFKSMIDNIAILGVILPVVVAYYLKERSKAKERLLLEKDKQKQQAMIVYQNYLNSLFNIMKDKDFSADNKNILETIRIIQSELPLFAPDKVLWQLAKMQQIGLKLVYFKKQNDDESYKVTEKENQNNMNKLIELMRKDLIPKTKITDNDIKNLLSNDWDLIESFKKITK